MSATVATTSNAIAVAPTAPQALGASVASPLMVETWADESWPLNSRQASEIITEQVLQGEHEIHHHHATQSACSSVDQVTVQNSSTQGDTLPSATSPSETTTGGTLTYTPTTTLPNQSFGSVMIHQFSGEAEEELSAAAPANLTTTASEPVTPSSVAPHVRRCYTHDPYCIYTGLKLIAVCTCPTCVPRPAAAMPQHVSPTEWNNEGPLDCYPETSTYPQPQEFHEYGNHGSDSSVQYPATSSGSSNWHKVSRPYTESTIKSMVSNNAPLKTPTSSANFTPYPARLPPALQQIQQSKLLVKASRQQEESATAPAIPLPAPGTCMNNTSMTSFMPPAPPLLSKCHRVLQHEGNAEEASAIISSMLVRWHGRVEKSQHQFLDHAEYCPTSETYGSLEDWSVACMDWWTHHFATRQMKYPPKKSTAKKSKKNKKAKKAKAAAAAAAKNASTGTKTASIAVGTADSSDDDEADQ